VSAVVIPFPVSKRAEPSRCPECGWKMPTEIRADRESVKKELVVYFNCPECDVSLVWPIVFDVE
jgi:predicted RNA-binding Zn-ribbon protein involved in translation (DUF1610 family)